MTSWSTLWYVNILYYMQALSQIVSQWSNLILFGVFIQTFNFAVLSQIMRIIIKRYHGVSLID